MGINESLNTYTEKMYKAQEGFEKDKIDAAKEYANKSAGGINKAAVLELQANQKTYEGAVKGAREVLDASTVAAQLRAVISVMSAVGHNVARNAEQGMALRY